ncbi:MAG: sigma-70 family RNA polymerase sigma factor [Desulfobacula sp.]|nr:sigma-70 family RNA polymerase sigma factor [Desulfobacula sp.]
MKHVLNNPSDWVEKYGDYLYAFAFYRVKDDILAQDLVQDALMGALKSKDKFKGTSSEKTWLTGIIKHKIIDAIRKKYRETAFEDKALDFRTRENAFNDKGMWKTGPRKWASNPEELLNQKDFLTVVNKCFGELPDRPGRALAMKELDGETTKTICKVLNVSSTNAWVILHRARALMRKCIEAKWLGEKEKT